MPGISEFPWYSSVDKSMPLEQGDIICDCSVILPGKDHYDAILNDSDDQEIPEVNVVMITAIIMSQSCDIANDKIDSVIVCPIWPLKTLIKNHSHYQSSKAREELRQGKSPAYHLLNQINSSELENDFYFVDFKHVYSVPKNFLIEIAKNTQRTRLLPPYREHLAQSFARYFMRVGLPTDIDPKAIKDYKV